MRLKRPNLLNAHTIQYTIQYKCDPVVDVVVYVTLTDPLQIQPWLTGTFGVLYL